MKTLILLGAGQMGQAAYRLVNQTHYKVLAFADNNSMLWGTTLCGHPLLSVEDAVSAAPDGILIAVAGAERTEQLRAQLLELGYSGQIRTLVEFAEALDIRNAVFALLADRLERLPGALAELGVYRGDFAAELNRRFPERNLYLFDTFEGFDLRDLNTETQNGYSRSVEGEFSDTTLELVLSKMTTQHNVVVQKGYFPDTTEGMDPELRFAMVSLDADLYEPTFNGLKWFYPRMVSGGVILLHDYQNARFSGVHAAVEAFERKFGPLLLLPVGDLHGSAMVIHP